MGSSEMIIDGAVVEKIIGAMVMGGVLFAGVLGFIYRALKKDFEERYSQQLANQKQITDQYKELVEVRDKKILDLTERVAAQEIEINQMKVLIQVLTERVNRMGS